MNLFRLAYANNKPVVLPRRSQNNTRMLDQQLDVTAKNEKDMKALHFRLSHS